MPITFPSRTTTWPPPQAGKLVHGDRHLLVIGSHDEQVVTVVGDRGGDGAALPESEPVHEADLHLPAAVVPVEMRELGDVPPDVRPHLA